MTDTTRLKRNLHAKVGQEFAAGGKRYKLEGVIGNGAIGVVRKVREKSSRRLFAVKFLAPELRYIEQGSLSDIEARFRREGTRGISLTQHNLVKIVAYEDNEDSSCFEGKGPANPFFVMEYVRGNTLESFIRRLGSPAVVMDPVRLYLARQIVQALVYLHERKLVHRDVKPANIFLSSTSATSRPSVVKLGDFGVCKWGDFKASVVSGTLTVTGQRGLGTFKYMSPEQALAPKDVTVRADMYSLGITLYELFTSQILPSQHHVFQLTQARLKRGHIGGKLIDLGLGPVPAGALDLFEPILDMLLTGASGRPTSRTFLGRLNYLLRRFEDV